MKNIIFTITIMLSSIVVSFAQEVTSAAGKTNSVAEYEVSWTLGEPVIETGVTGNYTLTQGFHQPKFTVTAIENFAENLSIKVYPNPTQQFILIQSDKQLENAKYALFGLSGKKLMEGEIRSRSTKLNLENRASGSYILKLIEKNNPPLQTFKIVKN